MVGLICLMLSSCTSETAFDKGKAQLEMQGYTDVQNTGYSWLCCGKDDTYSSGFIAKDKSGNEVSGCICSGFLGKGITIRFE